MRGYYEVARTEVKKEKIESHEVTFYVDDEGTWYAGAAILDRSVFGKSLIEARTKVRAQLRRATAKLEIKAHLVNMLPESEIEKPWYQRNDKIRANKIRPITITGIATRGSSEVLYTFDDSGAKSKKGGAGHSDPEEIGIPCRRLNEAEQAEYRRIRDAHDAAYLELKAWIDAHKIENLKIFVEQKIQEAIDEQPAEPEATADPRTDPPLRDSRMDGIKKGRRRG